MHKISFPYNWELSNGYPSKGIEAHGLKVFGTFVCAGGSTMGYKLAGFDHLGGVEFTDHYSELYKVNHKPKYIYTEDIRDFNSRNNLPKELYELDLLDGSPPCAAFSTVGAREKNWGKSSEYEGKKQVKDDLVFVYAETIKKLMPKVFLLENVSGLLKGNAKSYAKRIVASLSDKYNVQVFSLNAASMGVPQMRQRVFFIGLRKDIKRPKLVLDFKLPLISFEQATKEFWDKGGKTFERCSIYKYWLDINYPFETSHKKRFSVKRPRLDKPCNTLIESDHGLCTAGVCHPLQPRKLNKWEAIAIQTFPMDFEFLDQNPLSCIGRSVPPVMMAQIAHQIYLQWLNQL